MEQCQISSFLAGCIDLLKVKSLDTMAHASEQVEIICWFHTNDISVHLSDPKFTPLPDANTVF